MLPPERPDRIYVAFDDHRLVVNAGLLLPITLPSTWVWASWWTTMLTREMRRVGPIRETIC